MKRLRRWLVRLGLVLAVTLALLLLLAAGAVAFLKSSRGQALIRDEVAAAAQAAIEGKLEFGGVGFEGGHLVLTDLRLLTPEGELVVAIARVELDVDVVAALRGRYRVDHVRVETPVVRLVHDERGLNLSRAIASKGPPSPSSAPSRLRLVVADVVLSGGEVTFTAGARVVRLGAVAATGGATVTTAPLSVDATLALTAAGTAPVTGPVTLSVTTASPTPDAVRAVVALAFGDEVVRGTFDWPRLAAELEEVRVTPALMEALAGQPVLKKPVVARGTLSLQQADLTLEAGAARVTVASAFDLEAMAVSALDVTAEGVDLSEWFEGGKPSRLEGRLRGRASELSLESLTGSLLADATWKTPSGTQLADATARLSATGGQLTVEALSTRVPGAAVSLAGRASLATLALSGTFTASDLSKLGATVKEFSGVTLPPLKGRGTLAVQVQGPSRRPKVSVQGELHDLTVSTVSAQRLAVNATVPDVTQPLNANGTLGVTRLAVGTQTVESLEGAVTTRGRELDVTLATKGLGVGLSMGGTLDDDNAGLALSALQLELGRARWALERPARVAWGNGVTLSPLALRAGSQTLTVEGELRGTRLRAKVDAKSVDLGLLPEALVPGDLDLAGVVTLAATAEGPTRRPNVVLTASVAGGAAKGVTDVTGTVDGRFVDGRATGTVDVSSSLGAVDARVDVPVAAVLEGSNELLELDVEVRDVSLEALQRWRGDTWPATGTLGAHLSFKGPARDPAVAVRVRSEALTLTRSGALTRNLLLEPIELSVTSRESGALTVGLVGRTLGAGVVATVETPLTVPGLRAKLPDRAALLAMVMKAEVAVDALALEQLKTVGFSGVDDVKGRVSLKALLRGSVEDPTGQVTLRFEGVHAPPLEDVDGELELTASDTLTRLAGKGRMLKNPLFTLEALIDTPVRRLERYESLGPEHLTAHLSVAPMPLGRLLPRRDDEVMPSGAVSLELDMKGTLDEPKLTIDGTVQDLSFGRVALGQARLVSRTQGREQSLGLTLKARASELRATGTVGVDLSVGALRRGVTWAAVPLDVSLASKDFDLGFLSGVTPMVRTVGGQLSLRGVRVTGPIGNPEVKGSVMWTKGRLGLASYGDYRDIELEADLSRERIRVGTLSVRSGGGGLALDKAVAVRRSAGHWSLEAAGSGTRFPIVTGDQLLAILSIKFDLAGELSDDLVNFTRLDLPRVDVELPEVKRKDIQDLERPSDLVIVRGGRVIAGRRKDEGQLETPTGPPGRTYRAVLHAPRNVWLRSSDLNLELGLSEGFRVEYANTTQIFGEAQIIGGRIDVIGREFKVNRANAGGTRSDSTVRFAGPASQPYVNVTALHVNEREKVKVTVSVVGRGTDVALKVSSDPPMSESDIYTLLATGRRDLRRSSGASVTAEQAVSVIGSLAANELKNTLLKRLPIDIVDVVSIDTGAEGLSSTRVEVGKYLSDSLYLGFTLQPGANRARGESAYTGRLELQLSRDVSLEAAAGDAPTVGADVVWSRDF